MTAQAILTLILASLGFALGIYNAWAAHHDKRERLRVTPKWAMAPGFTGVSVEVINVGTIPVTLHEVGLLIEQSRAALPRRVSFPHGSSALGPALPHRLERGESYTTSLSLEDVPAETYFSAYATTATGKLTKGTSPAFKQMLAEGKIGPKKKPTDAWPVGF